MSSQRVMRAVLLILILCTSAAAQHSTVRTTVTYMAAGSIYLGAGRKAGIADSSTAVIVVNGQETVRLSFVAASSSSSVWTALSPGALVHVGDSALVTNPVTLAPAMAQEERPAPPADTLASARFITRRRDRERPDVELSGRIGVQWFSSWYADSRFDVYQPGMVMSVRGTVKDLPVRFMFYGNLRETARGATPLFSAKSAASSRLYRAMVEYNDGRVSGALGRIILPFAPTIGTLDGVSAAYMLGPVSIGAAVGFQPDQYLQNTDTDRSRIALFVSLPSLLRASQISLTYARSWYKGSSDREQLSLSGSTYAFDGITAYASADVDLRVASEGSHVLRPALSLLIANVTARVTDAISVSVGADASRPVLPFSYARQVPDSLADTDLRNGFHAGATVSLPYGIMVSTTYSPRSSANGFGAEYTDHSYLSAYNVFGTGVGVRASLLLASTATSSATGAGLSISRNVSGIDVTARVQRTAYRMEMQPGGLISLTSGIDLLIPLASRISAAVSLDRSTGLGPGSFTVFGDVSYRF